MIEHGYTFYVKLAIISVVPFMIFLSLYASAMCSMDSTMKRSYLPRWPFVHTYTQ